MMYLGRRILLAIAVFFVLSTYVLAMEWYEAYDKGKDKIEKGKCAEGVPLLLDAVKKQPDDDLKARPYGAFYIEYIPHFYLAKCAVESGDLKSAQQYIRDADAHGVASSKKASEYEALKRDYQTKLAQQTASNTRPPNPQNPQNQNTTTPPGPNPTNTTTVPKNTGPTPAELEAQRKLQEEQRRQAQIRSAINDAKTALNANRFDDAKAAAQQALAMDPGNQTAQGILDQIDKRRSQQQQAQQQAQQQRQDKINQVNQAMNSGNLTSAETLAMDLKRDYPSDRDIARLLDEVRKRKNDQLASQQVDAMKITERQVIVAYFSGRYETVIDLVKINEAKYQKSWRLPFYQGCALASLALLDEKGKEERQNQARESFRKAKQIAGDIPENPYISPKIWELFRSS